MSPGPHCSQHPALTDAAWVSAAAYSVGIPARGPARPSRTSPHSRETGSRQELADLGQSLTSPLPSWSGWVTSLKSSSLSDAPFLFSLGHALLKAGDGCGIAVHGSKRQYNNRRSKNGSRWMKHLLCSWSRRGGRQLPEAASVAPIDSTDKEVLPGILQWRFRLSESQGHT